MRLTEFLLARITEDENVARAATQGRWHRDPPSGDDWPQGDEGILADQGQSIPQSVVGSYGYDAWGVVIEAPDEAHILRWQPSRVLAECEAKRRIATLLTHPQPVNHGLPTDTGEGAAWDDGNVWALEQSVRALALPYADHPDYDEAWRP